MATYENLSISKRCCNSSSAFAGRLPPDARLAAHAQQTVARAQAVLDRGGMVLFPTETFYALGVDPRSETALMRLAALKERAGRVIPLIAADLAACLALGPLPPPLARLADAFWPGPLTLAFSPNRPCSPLVQGGDGTVGVRVAGLALARVLAASVGGLITSTSANLAGQPPAAHIDDVAPQVVAACDLLIDAGRLPGGQPSTVVGYRDSRVVLLRAGAVGVNVLESFLGASLEAP